MNFGIMFLLEIRTQMVVDGRGHYIVENLSKKFLKIADWKFEQKRNGHRLTSLRGQYRCRLQAQDPQVQC